MVSIIVPVYNIQEYLSACIDSIISQTYPDFEVILVDDGSQDNSGQICDEYVARDRRVKVIHKENGGVSSARNTGLVDAVGEWIMYVDGDDWIEPNMLELLVGSAESNNADIVIGDFKMVSDKSAKVYSSVEWVDDKVLSLNRYIASVWTTAWGSIIKRSLFEKNNILSPSEITFCEDFHLMVRLCFFANKIVHVNIPLYNYRQRGSSVMHNLNKRNTMDRQWVNQDLIRFFKEQSVYPYYKRTMNWRVLKSAQELLLDPAGLDRFQELYQDGGNDMWSCPFVNTKIKILAWLMTHHLRPAVVAIDKFRMILGR